MKRVSEVLGIVLTLAMLGACQDQPVAPRPVTRTMAGPMADFTNNPDGGGLRIGRLQSDGGWFVGWMDPGNFLAALHYTSDVPVGCPSAPEIGYMDLQFVFNPKDQEIPRWIGNYMGKVWVIVVDRGQAGDCQGSKLLASGWGTLHLTDDDALASEPSGHHNPDTFGAMSEGALTTPDGATVQYSGHIREVWDDNAQVVVQTNAQVVLH